MVSIHDYLNYRAFLRDAYVQLKAANRAFSYRFVAQHAGLASSGFVSRILNDDVSISGKTARGLAKAFRLSQADTDFFCLLVTHNQSRNEDERRMYLEQLTSLRRRRIGKLDSTQFQMFRQWYHVALREIIHCYPQRSTAQWLCTRLNPRVPLSEVRKGLQALEELGVIRRSEDGTYSSMQDSISTGDNWQSEHIRSFQARMAEQAVCALSYVPKEQRDMSTVTAGLSPDAFKHIKQRIAQLRNEILELAHSSANTSHVYHFNFQGFPLTHPLNEE